MNEGMETPIMQNEIYANAVGIRTSIYDFILQFGRHAGNNKMVVIGNVVISPQSAKELHRILGEELSKYEKTFGPVNVPKPDEK